MVPRRGRGLPCSPRVNALRLLRQPPRRNGETHRSRIVTFGARGDRRRGSRGYHGPMWWTDAEWAELVDPELCGMCADAHLPENEHSILVASTEMTHVRLVRNQAHPGYTVVILREHLTDLGQLDADQLSMFWRDVQRAGRAVDNAFDPRKINYLVMGHRAPHLHCHVFPQHLEDDPLRNVDISDGPVYLDDAELAHAVVALREAWHAVA